MSIFTNLFAMFRGGKKKKKRKKSKTTRQRGGGAGFVPGDVAEETVKVLVADLVGSGGNDAGDRIANALGLVDRVDVLRRREALKQAAGKSLLERLSASAKTGRAWLKEDGADILVWGEMEDLGTVMRFRFLPANPGSANQVIGFGLGDSLEVPSDADAGFDALVIAAALGAVGPGYKGARQPLLVGLKKVLAPIEKWADAPPDGLAMEQQASVVLTLGNALAAGALMGGGTKMLDRAALAFLSAGRLIHKESDPLAWAMTQNHLAAVLETQGRKAKTAPPMKDAADRYRGVAEALGRDEYPLDWGMAHVRLGSVLYRLASTDLANIAQHLKDASKAFEESLTVYSKETMPGRWAEVMNQYGVVLMALGEQLTGTATLEQAITAFKKTLEVRKREHVPLLWAQTSNNLGAASFALAKRNGEQSLLQDAAMCFEGAAKVFRETPGYAKRADVIESNQTKVEAQLAQRQAS